MIDKGGGEYFMIDKGGGYFVIDKEKYFMIL